jgi:hypothetical protein
LTTPASFRIHRDPVLGKASGFCQAGNVGSDGWKLASYKVAGGGGQNESMLTAFLLVSAHSSLECSVLFLVKAIP